MSAGLTVGAARWAQGDEGEETLEIRTPIVLPQSARAKDLIVEVKDLAVLRVSHKQTVILQWRLYEPVSAEVEWRVEDEGALLVVDLVKRNPTVWPCLLDLPMNADDKLLVPDAEFDSLFREHHPSIPLANGAEPVWEDGRQSNAVNTQPVVARDEEDLDRLLEEAAEEVATKEKNNKEFIEAELENCKTEKEEIQKKMSEVVALLESNPDSEAKEQAQKQKTILEAMLRLHDEIREKRVAPSSLASFLEVTKLDIRKARINVGELSEEEKEDYTSEAERRMTANELMVAGLGHLEKQEIQPALHFLRLATIHHNHEQSTLILHSMYAQLGSPRGAFLLLRRALQDDDLSAAVNLKVGEQFDTGARHFLPMFPAALYFYQRAARAGSVHAMLAIAQLYLRGCTSSTMLSVKQMESLRSVEKYQGWLQQAMDRGCGSAYFVKGCAHLKGEHGCTKSYALAKEYLDMATSSQPNIARRAPQVYVMLEKLREEEEGEGEGKPKGCSSVSGMVSSSADKSGNRIEDSGVVVSSSLERLKNIKSKLGTTNSSSSINTLGLRKAKAYRSGAKAFWEGAATTGLTLYSLYTLAFPIRVILLPHFYTLLGHLVDRVPWLASNPPTPF